MGYDGNEKIKGRKRRLLVDTNGLALCVFVSAADRNEREGAKALLTRIAKAFPRRSKPGADSG